MFFDRIWEEFIRDNPTSRDLALFLLDSPLTLHQFQMVNHLPVATTAGVEEAMHEATTALELTPGELPSILKSLIFP